MKTVCRAAYFHLLQLRLIISVCWYSKDTRAKLHYMSSRLLQRSVQWHLSVCRTRQRDSSQALVDVTTSHQCWDKLHWLPVRQRVDFKLALLIYKALHDPTAAYLVDHCQLVSHACRRRLRSADIDTCCVPRTNTQLGDRSFAAAGPRFWNSLPAWQRHRRISSAAEVVFV